MSYVAKFNRGRKNKDLAAATDMTGGGAYADIVVPPQAEGDSFGQTKDLQTQVDSVSNPADANLVNAARMIPPSPVNLGAATNKLNEPITSGIPLGAGDNGGLNMGTDTVSNFIKAAKIEFPDPIWDELLDA